MSIDMERLGTTRIILDAAYDAQEKISELRALIRTNLSSNEQGKVSVEQLELLAGILPTDVQTILKAVVDDHLRMRSSKMR